MASKDDSSGPSLEDLLRASWRHQRRMNLPPPYLAENNRDIETLSPERVIPRQMSNRDLSNILTAALDLFDENHNHQIHPRPRRRPRNDNNSNSEVDDSEGDDDDDNHEVQRNARRRGQ